MVSHGATETRGEGEKDRGDETGKDGGGERERGKKAIRVVTIEIDSLSQSELPSVSLSHLLTLPPHPPSLSFAAAAVAAAAVIRSLHDH